MSAWAKPGVKCVCVDAAWPEGVWHGTEEIPQTDQIYTIREVKAHVSGEMGILLCEIVNAPLEYADGCREAFWALRRFRPLVTKTQEQDVAKFRHLLTPNPVDAGLVPAGVELDA